MSIADRVWRRAMRWILGISFSVGLGLMEPGIAQTVNAPVLFRTKSYRVQIVWRGDKPLMTISNNGWRVLVNCPARMTAKRGVTDAWTSYTCASGEYRAIVRVGDSGERAIAVTLAGGRVTEEYATPPLQQVKSNQTNEAVIAFETTQYAVRVYRQRGNLWMNLYNKQSAKLELKRAATTMTNTTGGVVYQHEGAATVQARENVRGERSLYILQNNEIQYRGEGY